MRINPIHTSLAAVALSCLVALAPVARAADAPAKPGAGKAAAAKAAPVKLVGWLELSGPLRETPSPYAWLSDSGAGDSLRGVIAQIHTVADQPGYKGLVIYLDSPELTQSQVFELDQALRGLRAAGKKILVFAEAYDLSSYLLACSADQILLQRKGMIEMQGLGMEEMYMAGLFAKIGVKADFLQIGKFKGAEEPLTRVGPSDEWSKNIDGVLDDMYAQVIKRIAQGRKLTNEQVEKALADSWTMSDEDYVKRGLVDKLVDRDLTDATGKVFGQEFTWDDQMGQAGGKAAAADNPFALLQMLMAPPKAKVSRPSIALVNLDGAITSGESAGGLFGQDTVGSRTFIEALGDARDDDQIKGVVVRINSPGGSALASEVMWQAMRDLADEKPVFISVGGMAASGGYYVACAGGQIYATPHSIVGSIGVVGGKITLGGLYDKVGITVHRRSRGPLGDMFNSVEPFTDAQRQKLHAAFVRTYEQFVDRVRIGRGKRVKDIDAVAQGRLFTGEQAMANGLIDKLGGVDSAIGDLAAQVGLVPGQYDVVNLPGPKSFADFLESMLNVQSPRVSAGGAADQQSILAAARAALGPQAWHDAAAVLDGLLLVRREPVLTLMPRVIRVK